MDGRRFLSSKSAKRILGPGRSLSGIRNQRGPQTVKRIAIIEGMVIGLHFTAPAMAQTPYDGVWNVTVETRAGSCEASAHYRLTVQDGKVSGAADITGTVAHEGLVKVSLKGAHASGQLVGKTGSGKWNAAATGKPCSGHWQATKE